MKCNNTSKFHRKSGVAKWRDLLFIIRSIESEWKRHPTLCHPERSRGICSSRGLLLELFSDPIGVDRSTAGRIRAIEMMA
jgi:hypothetical protein